MESVSDDIVTTSDFMAMAVTIVIIMTMKNGTLSHPYTVQPLSTNL